MKLITLIQTAGLLHLGLLCAGATMPRAVRLGTHLAGLPPFIRRLVWVYYGFIASMLAGFGTLTFCFADRMAAGDPVARALCLYLACFWGARWVVAGWVFDVRPYLTHWFYRVGHYATTLVFVYLTLIYSWVAWQGGRS